MKKGIGALALFVLLVTVSPSVASAKWWNPFSWFQKSSVSHSDDRTTTKVETTVPPVIETKGVTKTITAKVGDTLEARGVTAKITGVEEDSRCAEGVQCVWAGTVKVKIHASYGVLSKNVVLTLNDPYTVQDHEVTLTDVTPNKKKGVTILPSEYTFTFSLR